MHNEELRHYGVKGMKWGVRKSDYKSMNRQQRKDVRKKYYDTPEGKVERSTRIGTILGGPVVGIIAGSIAHKRLGDVSQKTINNGKKIVEENKSNTAKNESTRVADIKSRVTGKKENGKPMFLMSEQEMADFDAKYE